MPILPPDVKEKLPESQMDEQIALSLDMDEDIEGFSFVVDELPAGEENLDFRGCRFEKCDLTHVSGRRISFVDCVLDHIATVDAPAVPTGIHPANPRILSMTKLVSSIINRISGESGRKILPIKHYPLTEPNITPLLKYFCKNGYSTSTGSAATTTTAYLIIS